MEIIMTRAVANPCRRFLVRPFHPPYAVAYSFLLARRFLPQHRVSSILEVGCGIGMFALRFAAEQPHTSVVAIDHSKPVIEYLSNRCASFFPNLRFATVDFCSDDAINLGTFQVLYSADVLEHVNDVSGFIRNGHHVLEKEGAMITNFPNQDNHGINHFSDTQSIMAAFGMFSEVMIYNVAISGLHHRTYVILRGLYELLFLQNTSKQRSDILNSDTRGVDCFEHSTCFKFAQSGTAINVAANIMGEAVLAVFKPRFKIRPISGSVRNKDRLVIVARK
ncbi:MAG: class I SAM-dependent methyltransferase [Candidatus Binataceae bacterium]